jgi:hypothetical protein
MSGVLESCFARENSVSEFAKALGLNRGVTGYSLHVVPIALYAWLRYPSDFRQALTSAIRCGGDTDTVGAIVGALCGCSSGAQAIPDEWLGNICEWPRSVKFMKELGSRLASQSASQAPLGPVHYFWPGQALRNIFFLVIVLAHGFRRLLP